MVPNGRSPSKYVLKLINHPDYLIMRSRWQYQSLGGIQQGTDYVINLELNDGSTELKQVQLGWRGPENCYKRPGGMSITLMRDDKLVGAGRYNQKEEILKSGHILKTYWVD